MPTDSPAQEPSKNSISRFMMFLRSRTFTPKPCGRPTIVFQRAAALAGLAGISALSACGGGQSPAKLTPANSPSNSAALSVSATLPSATQGSAYNGTIAASGGTAPYSYAVVSGQMPQGVSLDKGNGNVSGTPSASGTFSFTVSVSDAKGDSKQTALQINVQQTAASTPAPTQPPPSNPPPTTPPPSNPPTNNGNQLSNLQASGGWGQYGQGPPNFVDCSPSPCDGISFSMTQGVSSPSQSGNATVFWIGGTIPYSDALWNNHLIGTGSTQGLPDNNQTLVPSIYNFTYDV